TALAVIFSLAFSGLAQADDITTVSFVYSGGNQYIYTDDTHLWPARITNISSRAPQGYSYGYMFGSTWGNPGNPSPTDLNRLDWNASWLDFGAGQVSLSAIPSLRISGTYGLFNIGDFIPYQGTGTSFTVYSTTGLVSGQLVFGTPAPAVPEPETYALLLVGLGLVGFIARRRRNLVRR
ncbi:MAG: PEP-CTERM sorting domain-containing protein, partial [Zoogloeaceae bacterium]|nr:PEP-CTERM sorting domain-containing protein [Zoogloeaceae bacterium]